MKNEGYNVWIKEKKIEIINNGDEYVESKWWKITRFECTLIKRDYNWWNENVEHILKFYNDMDDCKRDPEKLAELKAAIATSKKRSSKKEIKVGDFALISDDED